jgi:hypothetical protein
MQDAMADMPEVTLELSEEEVEAIEDKAFTDHRGNEEAAIRTLLAQWLAEREE